MGSDIYSGSYRINSSGPKRLLKTQTFGKNKVSSEDKTLAYFFFVILGV